METPIQKFLTNLKDYKDTNLRINSLTGINDLQKDIISSKDNLQKKMEALYSLRNNFYSNLISSELGYIFLKDAEINLNNYIKSYKIVSYIESSNLSSTIDSIINCCKIQESDNTDMKLEISKKIEKLKEDKDTLKELLHEDNEQEIFEDTEHKTYSTVTYLDGDEIELNMYVIGDILKENGTTDYPWYLNDQNINQVTSETYVNALSDNKNFILDSDVTLSRNTTVYASLYGKKENESRRQNFIFTEHNITFKDLSDINVYITSNDHVEITLLGTYKNVNFIVRDYQNNGVEFKINSSSIDNLVIEKEDYLHNETAASVKLNRITGSSQFFYTTIKESSKNKYIVINTTSSSGYIGLSEGDVITELLKINSSKLASSKKRLFYNSDYIPKNTILTYAGSIYSSDSGDTLQTTIEQGHSLYITKGIITIDEIDFIIKDLVCLIRNKNANSPLVITPETAYQTYLNLIEKPISDITTILPVEFNKIFNLLKDSEETKCELSINAASSSLNKFKNIEDYRESNDAKFDNSISKNLKNIISLMIDEISTINTELDEYNKTLMFNSMLTKFYQAIEECKNTVNGLSQGIIELNKFVNNYCILCEPLDDYGTNIKNTLLIVDEAIESYKLPRPIRSFNTWIKLYNTFSYDGPYAYAQLYIGQELGLNALGATLNNDDEVIILLRDLVLNSLMETLKKGLFGTDELERSTALYIDSNGVTIGENIINYEAVLSNNNIVLNKNAIYENIPPIITNLVQDLLKINNYNFSDILMYFDNKDDNKLSDLIMYAFIKFIFADKNNPNNYVLKINKLKDLFKKNRCNFKTLLCEYYFYKLIKKITTVSNQIVPSLNILNSKLTELNAIYNAEFDNVKKLLNYYLYLWNFYYSSVYSKNATHIQQIFSTDFREFLYNGNRSIGSITMEDVISLGQFNNNMTALWNELIKY